VGLAAVVITASPVGKGNAGSIGAYDVVMASCNGRDFLPEQLESLLQQTIPPAQLVVVDDASNDGSADLIEAWATRTGIPLVMKRHLHRMGSISSFADALEASCAGYVFLCDQDDVWDRDKAESLLSRMAELEALHGASIPLLVHSDLRLIHADGTLQVMSFHRHQNLDPHGDSWLALAMQNVVTGCATLVNRSCLDAALPFPEEVVLHDWWLALVASGLGEIAYVDKPTLSYRQHGRNLVGASGFRRQMTRRFLEVIRRRNVDRFVAPGLAQLRAFWERFGERLNPPLRAWQVDSFSRLISPSPWRRLNAAFRLRLSKQGWLRTWGFYLCLLFWRPSGS
jgi:glycosyltransferase involved in cell wall biosynthesis